MLCMLMLFSASEMWATDLTVNVKCEPTGVAKVYAKLETDEDYTEDQKTVSSLDDSGNFNLKYDNLQEGYTFLGWSKGAPSTKASDMVSTDQVATVTVLSSEPTVTYYANFSSGSGSNFTITEDASISEHGTVTYKVNGTETAPVSGVINVKENDVITLIVTPNTGWVVDKVEGKWTAAVAKAPRRRATIGLLQDIDLGDGSTDQTTGAVTYSFTMERANAVISAAYKKLLTHADISITAPNQVFNGQDLQPVVTVKDGSTTLVKNKDYTLNIPECINVGEYAVVVTGKGFYTGMTSVTYKVTGRPINTLMISEVKPLTYTGKQHRPLVTVSFGETTLVKDQDYYLGYTNNINAGTAKMSIMGLGNYTGYAFLEFDITKAPLTVKADDAMVISGKQPSFTASYEGFVNNQTEAVLEGELAFACDYTTESAVGSTFAITPSGLTAKNYDITFVPGTLTVAEDTEATAALIAAREALQTVIGIATNVSPDGLADAIAAARAALTDESATVESLTQAAQTLEAAIKAYFVEVLPRLGAIVQGLNDETLNAAYADAQTTLAKEGVTLQELIAAMQNIITAAKAVAPEHLQNLKAYAVKYGAADAVDKVDAALAAIEAGNVSQIIATMTAVKEAATPLAQQVLSGIIGYVQAFGLTEQATQAQAALESGNYITMITTAKALFTHLIAAAKEYLPKLGAIVEGLNDETLNAAYADAQTLLAKESITPEELGAAMQNIIAAAKAVAPEHLQNLKAYAVKYGAADAVDKVDAALAAIEAGNVSQIIATMTAVKEAATPLATAILTQIIGYAQNYAGFADDVTAAQAAIEGGNYITMITTAKALYAKLMGAANDYVTSVKAIPTEGKNGVDELNAAILAAEQALAAQDSDFSAINTAISNLVAAVKAFNEANKPEPAEGIIYSWESPAGEVIEAGGTIAYVNGDGDRLNYKNGDYYTICLNGKKANLNDETASANAGHMVITLNKALEEGDVIAMTAYINKNESKKASAYIVFENGTSMEGEVYSDEANIDPAFGGVPTTKTMEVPAAAAGSKIVTLTRSQAGTNLFITKLEISEKSDLPTGIKNLTPALSKGEGVYNLNGQKVNKAQKGMYIINGHKVVIK